MWLRILEIIKFVIEGIMNTNDSVPVEPNLPPQAPPPPPPKPNYIQLFCTAIETYEGWSPTTRSYRNNNPANARYSTEGYLASYGVVKKDAQGFAIFKDYSTGWRYLNNMVKNKIKHDPSQTFYTFFAVYAPTSDGNDPIKYAEFVARACGLPADYKLGLLLS